MAQVIVQATRPRAKGARRYAHAALIVAIGLLLALSMQAFAQKPLRTLSGTVTDQGHEPLKGAVVEVVNVNSQSVVTYLTDKRGHYVFKRLQTGTDYQFFATYRGHRSHARRLGMFDNKADESVNLTIKLQ